MVDFDQFPGGHTTSSTIKTFCDFSSVNKQIKAWINDSLLQYWRQFLLHSDVFQNLNKP